MPQWLRRGVPECAECPLCLLRNALGIAGSRDSLQRQRHQQMVRISLLTRWLPPKWFVDTVFGSIRNVLEARHPIVGGYCEG